METTSPETCIASAWIYRDELLARARRRLGDDPAGAEDVVQEAYMRLLRRVEEGRGPAHVRAWLHRVVQSLCADERERAGRRAESPLHDGLRAPGRPPGETVMVAAEVRWALGEVARLPARERQAVLADVAGAATGAGGDRPSANAVYQALHRARRRLRSARGSAWGALPPLPALVRRALEGTWGLLPAGGKLTAATLVTVASAGGVLGGIELASPDPPRPAAAAAVAVPDAAPARPPRPGGLVEADPGRPAPVRASGVAPAAPGLPVVPGRAAPDGGEHGRTPAAGVPEPDADPADEQDDPAEPADDVPEPEDEPVAEHGDAEEEPPEEPGGAGPPAEDPEPDDEPDPPGAPDG